MGIARRRGRLRVPTVTFLTDFSVHRLWVAPGIDAHFALHELSAAQAGRLGAAAVSVTGPLIKQYKANLNAYCLGLKDYVTRRGGTYLFTSTAVPFDTLVLNYLRERGLLG